MNGGIGYVRFCAHRFPAKYGKRNHDLTIYTFINLYLNWVFRSRKPSIGCPVDWGCKIHRLLLCRGVELPQGVSWYDTKQSDGEVQVMLELWAMQSTPSFPSLPGPVWPRMVAPGKGPTFGSNRTKPCFREFSVSAFKQCIYAKLICLK